MAKAKKNKMKTKSSASKRFSMTATGKIKRSKANKQHILGKKSPKRKRRLRGTAIADKTNEKQIKRMLGK